MKIKIALLFGGKSVEHEVSVISALQAAENMDPAVYEIVPVYLTKQNEMFVGPEVGRIEAYRNIPALLAKSRRVVMVNDGGRVRLVPHPPKRFGRNPAIDIDVAFPVVHGTNVEDGTLQGFLKTLGVPFVGCDVAASALGMDKALSKTVLKAAGVPVLDALVFSSADSADMDALLDRIESAIGYPAIVKPVNSGSSVGIGVARNRLQLSDAVDDAFRYATRILAEHAISNLREINCAVLGDESSAEASECEEPLHSKDILSYEDKYLGQAKGSPSQGMAGVSRKIPAELSPERREEIRRMAVKAFRTLGCCGVARIDFMVDADTDTLYFNEINTIPGSLAFYLWEPLGLPYKDLLDRMVRLALKRARTEEALTFAFDSNILASASFGAAKGGKC
ncbi:MAG: D-alanine--D-alanine ligase [Kiritimatiellae bacterium]|nr:D-alanine--D-alanine ligase [Kiritimatiellia bacterium]